MSKYEEDISAYEEVIPDETFVAKRAEELKQQLNNHIEIINKKGEGTTGLNMLLTKLFHHYTESGDITKLEYLVEKLEQVKKFDIFKGNLLDFCKHVNIEAEQSDEQSAGPSVAVKSDEQSEKPSDEPEYIQIIRDRLTEKSVSDDTMIMFNFLTNNENGKEQLEKIAIPARYNTIQTAKMYEQLIRQYYTNVEGPPLLRQSEPLSKPSVLLESEVDELEKILKGYFSNGVLTKDYLFGCNPVKPIFRTNRTPGEQKKTTKGCCTHVCDKIDSLVSELEKFLTTKFKIKTTLSGTPLKKIAPRLDGRYKLDDKKI